MHIQESTLDDLLHRVFQKVLKSRVRTRSSKGDARELMAVMLTLENPRARFSRTEQRATLLTCLGETLWYLSGSNRLDAIEYYIPSYRTFCDLSKRARTAPGAYGPRLFAGKERTPVAVVDGLDACLLSSSDASAIRRDQRVTGLIDAGLDSMKTVLAKGAGYWEALRGFCRGKGMLRPEDERALVPACRIPNMMPTDKQAARLLDLQSRAREAGWQAGNF